jgi:subtilisin family serine protease
MVDAVSMSFGYFIESPADVAYTSGLHEIVRALLDRGVVVTAAAGNYTTRHRYYPAAFAPASTDDKNPLLSVGALNPNGSRAAFSDGGPWVTAWASGASVISTFPVDVNGPFEPDVEVRRKSLSGTIESLDTDDYRGGFAAWSGTSFATPTVAAYVIAAMLSLIRAESGAAPKLDDIAGQAAIKRVEQALGLLERAV